MPIPHQHRAAKHRGFTILEVLVASAILMIGLASIFALIARGSLSSREGARQSTAANLAASIFDDMSLRFHTVWADRDRNGRVDSLEEQNLEKLRSDRLSLPRAKGMVYDVLISYPPQPEHDREIFVTLALRWEDEGESRSEVFHRILFVKEIPNR